MSQVGKTTLKGYFNAGDVPTEANFADLIDSCHNGQGGFQVVTADTDLSADTGEYQFTLEQSSIYNEGLEINDTVNTFGVLLEETDGDQIITEDEDTSAGENILLENSADSGNKSYLIQETYIVGDGSTTSGNLDKSAQNELFDQLDDNVLDFSESNPFGDAGSKG